MPHYNFRITAGITHHQALWGSFQMDMWRCQPAFGMTGLGLHHCHRLRLPPTRHRRILTCQIVERLKQKSPNVLRPTMGTWDLKWWMFLVIFNDFKFVWKHWITWNQLTHAILVGSIWKESVGKVTNPYQSSCEQEWSWNLPFGVDRRRRSCLKIRHRTVKGWASLMVKQKGKTGWDEIPGSNYFDLWYIFNANHGRSLMLNADAVEATCTSNPDLSGWQLDVSCWGSLDEHFGWTWAVFCALTGFFSYTRGSSDHLFSIWTVETSKCQAWKQWWGQPSCESYHFFDAGGCCFGSFVGSICCEFSFSLGERSNFCNPRF